MFQLHTFCTTHSETFPKERRPSGGPVSGAHGKPRCRPTPPGHRLTLLKPPCGPAEPPAPGTKSDTKGFCTPGPGRLRAHGTVGEVQGQASETLDMPSSRQNGPAALRSGPLARPIKRLLGSGRSPFPHIPSG